MKEGFGGMPRSRIALETGMLGLSDRHITNPRRVMWPGAREVSCFVQSTHETELTTSQLWCPATGTDCRSAKPSSQAVAAQYILTIFSISN